MAKIKDIEGYFLRLRELYEEIKADHPQPGMLEELDGDRRILVHATFYIVSKTIAKKLDGMRPFEVLRLLEESMLRIFVTDPNSERVDRMLEKADLTYEILPYILSQSIIDGEKDEYSKITDSWLFEALGLLQAAAQYAIDVDEDRLDPVLDSLSLRTGKVGSPIIEADAAQIMEEARDIAYDIENDNEEEDQEEWVDVEAPTIAELRGLDRNRQMLVIGLMSINMEALVDGVEIQCVQFLQDDINAAISAFEEGGSNTDIDECIDNVIESIKDVVSYITDGDHPCDKINSFFYIIFTGILAIYIHNAHDLSDKDLEIVWSEVCPDGKFDDEALISYSRKIVDRDLPNMLREFNDSQK